MPEARLIVLYPHPTDPEKFDRDYREHLRLLDQKLHIAEDARPYNLTRFKDTPMGRAPYYQMFMFPFPSFDALQEALRSPELGELAADAVRISSGGSPLFVAGTDETPVLNRT